MVTERCWKSVTVAGKAEAVLVGDAAGAVAASPHAAARRTIARTANQERKRIWRTPFSRRCVCRERVIQATRVRARARHGGGTLPESHRLRWNPAYSVIGLF